VVDEFLRRQTESFQLDARIVALLARMWGVFDYCALTTSTGDLLGGQVKK
jgi:hypothetical protein